jgi:hypothetical protein
VLSEQPRLAGAKTLNRLENVLARSEWDDAAIAEGLLADAAAAVIEGTMSNLFVGARRRVVTPDLSRCGVVGAQRERVRELLAGAASAVEVADLDGARSRRATRSSSPTASSAPGRWSRSASALAVGPSPARRRPDRRAMRAIKVDLVLGILAALAPAAGSRGSRRSPCSSARADRFHRERRGRE